MTPSDSLTLVGFAITLGIAIVGWNWLRRADERTAAANQLAEEANTFAARAVHLAAAAEERADRIERAQRERRDVRWVKRPMDGVPGHEGIAFFNAGADTAENVELRVAPIDGSWSRPSQPHGTVEPDGRIAIDMTSSVREVRQRWEDASQGGMYAPSFSNTLPVAVTITWTSPLGVPGVHTENVTL